MYCQSRGFNKIFPGFSDGDKSFGKCVKRKKDAESNDRNGTSDEDDKQKKVRTTFTGKQIFELEKTFETKKYLSSAERAEMAKLLNVTEQQVRLVLFW